MAITWGTAKTGGGNGFRLGVEWVQTPATVVNGTTSVTLQAKIYIWTKYSVSDSSNTFSCVGTDTLDSSTDVTVSTSNDSGAGWDESNIQLIRTVSRTFAPSYTATVVSSVNVTLSGLEAVGTSITASVASSHTTAKRPYAVPSAPTSVTSTRVSDTQHTIGWTNNSAAGAVYESQVVQRTENGGTSYYDVATVAGAAVTYSDTTTVANKRYAWRVKAVNTGGTATSTATPARDTTPAAPTGLIATKPTLDVVLAWTNPAGNEVGIEVWASQDGGTYALLATTAADATDYTHTAPSGAATWKYKVRAKATSGGTLYSAYSNESETIIVISVPNAPTALVPSSEGIDGTTANTFTWQHNPADGTAQTNYSLRHRPVAGSWTTVSKTASADSERVIAAGTFTNGTSYEWQVQTWGQHADAGAWSAIAAFTASAAPVATLTVPGTDAYAQGSSAITAEWTYADTQAQAEFTVTLYDDADTVLYTTTRSGADTSFAIPYALEDAHSYKIGVSVRDSYGVPSVEATHTLDVTFTPPPTPSLDATFDEVTGSVLLAITNPAGSPAVVTNAVYRVVAGVPVLIADNLPVQATLMDTTPVVGIETTYRVIATSATPTSAPYDLVATFDSLGYFYLNSATSVFRGRLNPKFEHAVSRQTVVEHYAGREKALLYEGVSVDRSFGVAAVVFTRTELDTLEAVIIESGPKVYRDPYGRRVVCATPNGTRISEDHSHISGFSFDVVEIDG